VYVQRVVVGVSGSAGSLQALRYAVEMARFHDAMLVPVLAWVPPGAEIADQRFPCHPLHTTWRQLAWDNLWRAVELAIGGPPDDIGFSPEVIRGEAGKVLARVAAQPDDVLVIGAGRQGAARRMLTCRVARYCLGHASCPVIAVPPSQLATKVHGLHGWVLRHRLHPEDAEHAADA
jgi:nucleotide-binding universal stress UspA family protein